VRRPAAVVGVVRIGIDRCIVIIVYVVVIFILVIGIIQLALVRSSSWTAAADACIDVPQSDSSGRRSRSFRRLPSDL
jgi:hypothetical protein